MQIFFSRSHPAPDVTLRLVCVEDFAGLAGKGGVDLEEALGDVRASRARVGLIWRRRSVTSGGVKLGIKKLSFSLQYPFCMSCFSFRFH